MKIRSILLWWILMIGFSPVYTQEIDNRLTKRIEAAIDSIEPLLPNTDPLFSFHLRDVQVCKGPGKSYYLTGTTDDNWGIAEGIRVWKSMDLKNWELIGENGFVWTFDKDAVNEAQKKIVVRKGRTIRGVWAPEIHYIQDNFWICYSISNGYGSGLLKSTSGKPEGPYVDIKKEAAMVQGIDATLFQDGEDVWYIWGPGKIKKMNREMSGFANDDPPLYPKDASGKNVGYEGVNMYKRNQTYYLMAAEWNTEGPDNGHLLRSTDINRRAADGRYDCMIAMSDKLTGPYTRAYIAIPHGGHNNIFDDFDGNIHATLFGNDEAAAPFRELPAIINMQLNKENRLVPVLDYGIEPRAGGRTLYVSSMGDNSDGSSWEKAFHSLQEAVDRAENNTQIWVRKGKYKGSIIIDSKKGIYIYGGFMGNENRLSDRPPKPVLSILDGKDTGKPVVVIKNPESIRIDGFNIRNGEVTGKSGIDSGGGIHLTGGGELTRIVNCRIENNSSLRNGGGLYASEGASPLFINCDFSGNISKENGGAAYIECNKSNGYHTRFYHCHFKANKALLNGGIAWFRTNLKQTGTLRFINCLLEDNFTLLEEGNIVLKGGATLLMSHCTVTGNKGMSKGAAVISLGRVPAQNRIVNSIFHNNYGATLINADAWEGTDPTSGRAQNWTEVLNCLFYKNNTLGLTGYTYKLERLKTAEAINATRWGNNNISGNPLFINPSNSNFHVQKNSPAIKSGTSDNGFPVDCDGDIRITDRKALENSTTIGYDEVNK